MDTDAPIVDQLTALVNHYESHCIDAHSTWDPIIRAFVDIPALQVTTMNTLDDLNMPESFPIVPLTPGADTLQTRMDAAITTTDTTSRREAMAAIITAGELICSIEH
jgi:hypothetical protein